MLRSRVMREAAACYLCGRRDLRRVAFRRFGLLRCPRCGLIRTDPPPPPETANIRYREDRRCPDTLERPEVFAAAARRLAGRIRARIPAGSRILDVGCGAEYFLDAMRRSGCAAFGIDLSRAALRSHARRTSALASWYEMPFPDGTFAAVSASAVFEHVRDPLRFLREARRILMPGGILAIANSPDYRGWIRLWQGESWYGYGPEEHVWQLTPRSVRALLARAGFEVLRIYNDNMHHVLTTRGGWKSWILRAAFACLPLLRRGDCLTAIARRPP